MTVLSHYSVELFGNSGWTESQTRLKDGINYATKILGGDACHFGWRDSDQSSHMLLLKVILHCWMCLNNWLLLSPSFVTNFILMLFWVYMEKMTRFHWKLCSRWKNSLKPGAQHTLPDKRSLIKMMCGQIW